MFQDLRQRTAAWVTQHPETMVQIAVQFHETNGGEAVEPGVGGGLHDRREALLRDPLRELAALDGDARWIGLTLDDDDLPLRADRRDAFVAESELGGAAGDGGDEVAPGLGGVGFELIGIHGEEGVRDRWPLGGIPDADGFWV